ncbi:MAG: flagellar biosynthetic protein FliR [Phycisphaerae bacterium]
MSELFNIAYASTLLLAIARMAGIFLVAPVFSHTAVPVRLRLFMAVVAAVAVAGRLGATARAPADASGLLAAAALELMIGAAVGYAARLVFAGVEMGAAYIGQQMGVGLIEALNPLVEEDSGAARRLYEMLTIVVFLAIGGHRVLLSGLLATFDAAPLASGWSASSLLDTVTGLLWASFALALKTASPVLIALILATVAMGLVQRSVPQLNIFSVGFPVYTMLGLLALAAALAVVTPLVKSAWRLAADQMGVWLKAAG